jgi:hypothetical protein
MMRLERLDAVAISARRSSTMATSMVRHHRSRVLSKVIVTLSSLVFSIACGESSSPTAPTPSIPNVAGNYSGSLSIALPELGQTLTCPGTTTVTQSGSTVSLAPIALSGVCAGLSIPLGSGTIDATGNLTGGTTSGSYTDPSCGTYSYTGSGGFFGRDLRISMVATSRTCYNMNITINMSR